MSRGTTTFLLLSVQPDKLNVNKNRLKFEAIFMFARPFSVKVPHPLKQLVSVIIPSMENVARRGIYVYTVFEKSLILEEFLCPPRLFQIKNLLKK